MANFFHRSKTAKLFCSKVCDQADNSLLHLFALQSDEDAAVFLVEAGAAVDQVIMFVTDDAAKEARVSSRPY